MATGDVRVQGAVHSLEQGRMATIIKGGMFGAVLIALVLLYLFVHFKGLSVPSAMDQAQIARNIAAGKGFTTKNISPLAIQTLKDAGKVGADGMAVDLENFPDIYQSPLLPYVNSLPLKVVQGSWKLDYVDFVYAGDRMVAFTAMLFFLLGTLVWFFVFRKLFDVKLAFYAICAVLVTDLLWQFSLSGLPQMLLLFLFGVLSLLTLYAEEAQERGAFVPTVILVAGCGFILGLMVLAHGLALWLALGWMVYAAFVFRPRGLMVLAALGSLVLLVVPWLMRNYAVSGNPLGLAFFGAFHDGPPHLGYLRSFDPSGGLNLQGIFRRGITAQLENLPGYFGISVAAMAFFLAILHRFRNPSTSAFRWGLVSMWFFTLLGMCFYRPEGPVSDNQLHVIFLPIFICYGFAFLLVLWGRWEFGQGLLRIAFISAVIFFSGVPLIMTLLAGPSGRVHWPPYVPPFVAVLGDWFKEDEVVCADMSWAVAWYADRYALLIPESVRDFTRMHDYQELRQPLRGLYLTPVSGNQPLFSQIYKGRFREWALLITRPPQVRGFPFAFFTALPPEGEIILFSDRDRWNQARRAPEDE
jgi:hypothetical protein